jgi:hypothetical protein
MEAAYAGAKFTKFIESGAFSVNFAAITGAGVLQSFTVSKSLPEHNTNTLFRQASRSVGSVSV